MGLAIAGGVLVVLYAIWTFTRLIRLRQLADNAWADIDVQLKRRHDLIPSIVAVVKGHAGYERGTLESVVEARSRALQVSGPAARGGLAPKHLRHRRGVPGSPCDGELPRAPAHPERRRGSPPERAPVLQRRGAGPQHGDRAVPLQPRRRIGAVRAAGVLRSRRRLGAGRARGAGRGRGMRRWALGALAVL